MVDNCEYFLHSRDGNSFYFRHKEHPNTDMQGFTLTYVKPGYTVLTGDMGHLCWHRNESGFDYGFPGKNTDLSYFAEKVRIAEHTQIARVWNIDKAFEDIREHFNRVSDEEDEQKELDEDKRKAEEMLECACWDDCGPVVGQFKMIEDLNENFPEYDEWYEYEFGEEWEESFVTKFKMIQSVSDLVLEAVKS